MLARARNDHERTEESKYECECGGEYPSRRESKYLRVYT